MIITKLITPKTYHFKTKTDGNRGWKQDEEAMKDYPKHILAKLQDENRYGSDESTTLDWEINQYLMSIKGQEYIDIKYHSSPVQGRHDSFDHIEYSALVITAIEGHNDKQ